MAYGLAVTIFAENSMIDYQNYKESQYQNLKMAFSYFRAYIQGLACELEKHEWDDWNCRVTSEGNLRCCKYCKIEMPDSREGQENYRTFKNYQDSQTYV